MSYSVYQYYQNGGRDALVLRLFHAADHSDPNKYEQFKSIINVDNITIKASNPGSWSKNLKIVITHPVEQDNPELFATEAETPPVDTNVQTLFNVEVKEKIGNTDVILENFLNVSTKPNSPRFIGRLLNQESDIVRVDTSLFSADAPVPRPAAEPARVYGID